MNNKNNKKKILLIIVVLLAILLTYVINRVGIYYADSTDYDSISTEVEHSIEHNNNEESVSSTNNDNSKISLSNLPEYNGKPYIEINGNVPYINNKQLGYIPFEEYSVLDNLGRCGVAYANICEDIMPTEKRGDIGSVKPTGWIQNKYPDLVDGGYIYNRCHLIGYQLAGENANKQNLITGTRYLNIEGMLPWENKVADYVKETKHHVYYRVTPIFKDNNLLASGVLIEAQSVEDNNCVFCVYAYNVQPGIHIEYSNGDNWREDLIQYRE